MAKISTLELTLGLSNDASTAPSGSYYGPLWLESPSGAFPETEWHDFAVVVLSWWIPELAGLILNRTEEAKLSFMDGPYSVSLRRKDHSAQAEMYRYSDRTMRITDIDLVAFHRSVSIGAAQLVRHLRESGLDHVNDLSELAAVIARYPIQ